MKKNFTLIGIVGCYCNYWYTCNFINAIIAPSQRESKQCTLPIKHQTDGYCNYSLYSRTIQTVIQTSTYSTWAEFGLGRAGEQNGYGQKVTERPINQYLGFEQDGMDIPMVICPSMPSNFQFNNYKAKGTTYYGNDHHNSDWVGFKRELR